MKRASTIAIILVAIHALAAAQPAPSPEERAGELVDEAIRHYNVGEYTEAIAAYKEAYKLVPEPLLLWNLGQAYRLAGDCAKALTSYRSYVREAPAGDFRAMADQRIPEMEACAKKATPPVTDKPVTDTPIDPRVNDPLGGGNAVPPGGESGGFGPSAPGAGEPVDAKPGGTLRMAGYALGGVGVLGLAAGGYFTLKARDINDQAESLCATECAGSELVDLDRRGDAADRNATIGFIAGGVALAAGVTAIVLASRGERRATVTLVPTPGGAAASAAWSF